tara:strand:+ start:372 stop:665 length:294 start_codon:yes stop_codon:yes gene_type:complete
MKKELTYEYRVSHSRADAYKVAIKALESAERDRAFPVRVDFSYNENNFELRGRGSGFEVKLEFSDTYLDLFLDLSFVLRPAKRKILAAIQNELGKCL